jgi:hypothetical protein
VFWRVRCSSLLHALTLTIVTSHLPLLRQQTFLSPTLPAFSHPPQESTLTVHPSRSAAVMAPLAVPPEVSLDKMSAELTTEIMSHIRPHDLTKLARASKRYRGFAQSALWRNIELHRQDAHHDCFALSTQKELARAYLDSELPDAWSYRGHDGTDLDFDRWNAKFSTAIRRLYKTAGKSEAWGRLALLVRHLCLTVTHKSPPQIWNMMLSLPNLHTIEVIGEYSANR